MFVDNLTIVSLVVAAVALGNFVYACLIRSCISRWHQQEQCAAANAGRNDRVARNRSRGE